MIGDTYWGYTYPKGVVGVDVNADGAQDVAVAMWANFDWRHDFRRPKLETELHLPQ